jgi:hypothetical protein
MHFFALAALASAAVFGQTFQGGIRGTISDTTGAAVDTAKITLTEEGTGIARSTISGSGGEYSFTALNPATYKIYVAKPGFKVYEKTSISVSTQEFLTVDVALTVGDVTQSVNVMSEVSLLETTNASTGQIIDAQKIADLPNMGRNPFYGGVKISQNITPGGNPQFNRM